MCSIIWRSLAPATLTTHFDDSPHHQHLPQMNVKTPAEFVRMFEGSTPIEKILIANNGIAVRAPALSLL